MSFLKATLLSVSFLAMAFIAIACAGQTPAAAPTSAPAQPTSAPAQPTSAPTQPTSAPAQPSQPTSAPATGLKGQIAIDGSSTVFPITEAMAEEYGKMQKDVKVTVGIKGTGGGFKVFCSENAAERTAIQDASRAIKKEEADLCEKAGIKFTELLVGLDGLTVVVNPENGFAACLTTEELKKIWDTGSTVKNWNEVRADFPNQPLTLYGPGTDSGTFDFFTEVINGKAKQSRPDFTASEDDNTLVQGVEGDKDALGYFGLAYYLENKDKLKAVEIDGGKGCVAPSFDTVADGTYAPLSRPLYIYVNLKEFERPEVKEFVKFYMENAKELVNEVGYVNVQPEIYAKGLELVAAPKAGATNDIRKELSPSAGSTSPQPTAVPAAAVPSINLAAPNTLSGQIAIDGSSTVFPITEAMAEEYGKMQKDVKVTVGIKGTGGGFKVFCSENAAERTAIQDASRAIKKEEADLCEKAGIKFTELLVGLDGLTVVVNPENGFAACLTTEELKKIWDTGSTVKNWNEVRADFPNQPLTLYGPGTDSGTFDFFTEVINGKAKQSRPDFTASEDDNTLVQGVEGDKDALGYFGLAYYLENKDKLKAVEIDGGKGCVAPSFDTVADGTYAPLSRPLYIYVNNQDLKRPEVFDFVTFYLANAKDIVDEVGYVNVADEVYAAGLKQLSEMQK